MKLFFKEIVLHKDGPFGQSESYVIKVEFQARGSPHIHSFVWVKDPPILHSETKNDYIAFVDSIIRADLPDKNLKPDLFKLVSQCQTHTHSRTCRKYKNIPCRFNYGRFFTERTICSEPLSDNVNKTEKEKILNFRSKVLSKVKNFIDEFLNPHKPNYNSDISITALSISPDEDFQIHLRRPPNSCFVNNYFAIGLESWEANMDISTTSI